MGTWNYKNFENDDAQDLVSEVIEAGFKKVAEEIKLVALSSENDYLEAPIESRALAAIEIIAAFKGNPSVDLPNEMRDWLAKSSDIKIDQEILTLSKKALERILGENSEIKELWQEVADYENWVNCIKDLEKRIS